jgi:hypothetical protein
MSAVAVVYGSALLAVVAPHDAGCRTSVPLSVAVCEAADGQKLFDVDINKQKATLEKDFRLAEEYLSQTKLQNARSQADLLDHKLTLMKPNLSKEEAASYRAKIDNVISRTGAKEDSLVKAIMDILHTRGVDPALQYLQNEMKMYGVSEKKASAVEKTILDEAPAVQQSMERKAIERTVKALQNNQPLDPDLDPYIIKTAERIIKAHSDSILAVENAKQRKEMEEKMRQERIQKDKEDKEKKLAEEKAAKLKQEEDKKRVVEQAAERKKLEAETKEKQRLAAIEEERRKKVLAQQDKAIKDSLAEAQKLAEQQAKQEKERQNKLSVQQKEQERLARVEEDRKKLELAQREKARTDSLAVAQKLSAQQEKERQGKLSEQQKEQERLARIDEDRKKQELAQREKTQKDSIAKEQALLAAAKKSEKTRQVAPVAQKLPQPQVQPQQQQIPSSPQQKPQVLEQIPAVVPPSQPSIQQRREEVQPASLPPTISKAAQEYLKGLRDNQKKAQGQVMDLYDMIDKKQARQALEKFKQDRSFIAQYVDAQVFNVLEQTIAQSVMLAPAQSAMEPSGQKDQPKAMLPEQEIIDKINSFMRDNKIEAAYGELKRTEKSLRRFMTREDFRQLKEMVENAYKIRKQAGKSK